MKQITTENIALIKSICINNGITFYDIQLEAIDHIASMVEARWQKHPDEDFETALNAVVSNVEWSRFRKSNYRFVHDGDEIKDLQRKRMFLFVGMIFICFILITSIFNFDTRYFNETIYNLFLVINILLSVAFLISALWIAYKFKKSNFYLSNLYKSKYWAGILFSLLSACYVMHNIDTMINSPIHKNVYFLISGSLYLAMPILLIYYLFIKVILKAQQKFPNLYGN